MNDDKYRDRNERYILDEDNNPIPCSDLMDWGKWLEESDRRRVAQTDLLNGKRVSTVFLGLDHQYGEGPPLLWETMIFTSKTDYTDEYMWRYSSHDAAVIGHKNAIKIAKQWRIMTWARALIQRYLLRT